MKRTLLLDSLVLTLFVSLLVLPLFRLEYMDYWSSIESTFISDARMLDNHLPHPGWQPLWYCGTRFDYVYPPALRYGTALVAKIGSVSTARAYHIYTAVLYVFGIVSIYWLVRIGSGSRLAALLASVASALLSPSFIFLPINRHDSLHWVPQRLHVLALYGEGPHISALCILPAALAVSFIALRRSHLIALGVAGILCALVVANNFYGATALAIFFPVTVFSVWTSQRDWRVWMHAALIGLLAYGLSAFWLTPSYLKYTVINLKWVSQPGNTWSEITLLLVVIIFCFLSLRLGSSKPGSDWTIFVAGVAALITLDVLGWHYLGFRVTGEPQRLIPELDLVLIVAFIELMRAVWKRKTFRIPAAVLITIAFLPALRYLPHAWSPFPKSAPLSDVYEHQINEWVHEHLPDERAFATGTLRFWFEAWSDNAQTSGGSDQGLLDQVIPTALYQLAVSDQVSPSILWLQALGTAAIIVPDKTSREPYHDFHYPEKFAGHAPVLFDDHQGTVIYRIPRVHPTIGRIVDTQAIQSVGLVARGDLQNLTKYVSVIENPTQPLTPVTWQGFDQVDILAQTAPGQSVLLQETYDPAWHAYENGKPLPVRVDPVMSFMLIDVPAGAHNIQMHFETPLENRVGQLLFVLTALATAGLFAIGARAHFTKANSRPA